MRKLVWFPRPNRRAGGAVVVLLLLACPFAAGAQVLPPIYKPLAEEEGARFQAAADSLRKRADEIADRGRVLEDGARTLRQNGTGVAEKLSAQAAQALGEARRLQSRADADMQTAAALRGQAEEFGRRAADRERLVIQGRDSLARLRTPDPLLPDSAPVDTLGSTALDTLGSAPVDTLDASRIQALLAEVRVDSQTASTFRAQASELSGRAEALQAGATSARARAAELRRQHEQLQGYAAEILSGRGAAEPTAIHLEREAGQLRAQGERYSREAQEQDARAEALRAQASRNWLPVRSRTEAMRFYGEEGRSVLRSVVFSLGEGVIPRSVNGEVVSDYVGPVRIGAGLVLAKSGGSKDSTTVEDAALKRFYAGGGNFVLHATLPLLFHRSHYHSFTIQTLEKLALDAPGSGPATAAEEVPLNLDLGLEAYATFNTFASRIKAFALLRSGYVSGNAAFHRNRGREAETLAYLQLTFGTEIASLAKLLLSGARAADGMGQELSLTVQLAR